MKIVPAILTSDIDSFWDQLNKLTSYYNHFHIDIIDGTIYGNNKTVTIDDISKTVDSHTDLINKIVFDIHFMVKHPSYLFKNILDLKSKITVKTLYFHYKTRPNIHLLYADLGIKIGLTIDSDDSIDEIYQKYDLKSIKNIVLMTIIPGAQGQSFLEYPLYKIEQLRVAGYRFNISIDGGVNDKTIPLIFAKNFLPDFLNIGSFFSKSENIQESVKKINSIIQAFPKGT